MLAFESDFSIEGKMADKCRSCGADLVGKERCGQCGNEQPAEKTAAESPAPQSEKGGGFLTGVVAFFVVAAIGIGAYKYWVSIQAERTEACSGNLKQIGHALHNYHDTYLTFPSGSISVDGKPRHSWRVLLLPYLGEEKLYAQIRIGEPWDSPHNSQFHDQMPAVYRCPSRFKSSNTSYLAFESESAIFYSNSRTRFRDVTDGTDNTIAVIDTGSPTVNWMEPRDIAWKDQETDPTEFLSPHDGNYHFVTVSADVRHVSGETTFEDFHSMVRRNDGKQNSLSARKRIKK